MFDAPVFHSNSGLYGFAYASVQMSRLKKTGTVRDTLQSEFPDIQINRYVSSGSFKEELQNFIDTHRVEAAVMGLETRHKIHRTLASSHGISIAGKINAPVIIVPKTFTKHRLSNILLAVDNTKKLLQPSLKGFEKFLLVTKANLKILHVKTEDEITEGNGMEIKINGKKEPVEVISAKKLEQGVSLFCKRETIDLVVIISKKHSIFYDLFLESNSLKIIRTASIPVMVIHE